MTLYRATEVARRAGMSYDTLLMWLRAGVVQAQPRERKQWVHVLFTPAQAREVERKVRAVRAARAVLRRELSMTGEEGRDG